ncbi:tRNA pseudouridine(55) synthase TruB [Oceanibium sediminis]|uniref:tRNA pseudouridine(55) synthase TruB n=1 Tax=Oceanibium sediminis TaxID=2026339 RepID=UPI000DD2E54E|nr:tRNA pseudouridine(55) synthase TruB [Oceanibium sediminis]
MARRKKGRALTGWLIVDKPAGVTSSAVVNKARWLLQAQKAGHAGTLDPAATGLLVIAFGEATKALPYITDALKAYDFTVRWGAATTTDDAEGEVIATSPDRPTEEQINAALPGFRGDITQTPPAFSAVKVDGQRAYDLARGGETPELQARPLYVDELTLDATPDADHAQLHMVCGKGGYVRAIARDLGEVLGCKGHVASLRRIWSGPFALDDAKTVQWHDDIAAETLEAALQPLEAGLAQVAECRVAPGDAGALSNGNPVTVTHTTAENGDPAWASVSGAGRALGTYKFGHFHPARVFVLPEQG